MKLHPDFESWSTREDFWVSGLFDGLPVAAGVKPDAEEQAVDEAPAEERFTKCNKVAVIRYDPCFYLSLLVCLLLWQVCYRVDGCEFALCSLF